MGDAGAGVPHRGRAVPTRSRPVANARRPYAIKCLSGPGRAPASGPPADQRQALQSSVDWQALGMQRSVPADLRDERAGVGPDRGGPRGYEYELHPGHVKSLRTGHAAAIAPGSGRSPRTHVPPARGSPVSGPDESPALGATRRLNGPLLRPEEAARLLAVKPSWIYEAVRTGRLPCLRVVGISASRKACSRTGSRASR